MVEEIKDSVDEGESSGKNEDSQNKKRIQLKTAYDAMQPQEPIKWIVEGLISEGSVSAFYGQPGIGKTWTMLSLAVHVAEGIDWLGFTIPEAYPVLVIDEESGQRRLLYRLRVALEGEKGNSKTPIYTNSLARIQLELNKDMALLEETIKETNSKLLIIDSLSACMSGDENSKQDTQPVFNNLKKLANRTDCAIIIIHHAGKNGGYRGSSAIEGAVDLMIKATLNKQGVLEFVTEKTRDIEFLSWSAEMVWVGIEKFFLKKIKGPSKDKSGKQIDKEEKIETCDQYILDYLTQKGNSKKKEIIDSTKEYAADTIRKVITDLKNSGKIKRVNENKRGVEAIYQLA
jgi:KaiC/GvpD/RAD55 family RecA-like ATPase